MDERAILEAEPLPGMEGALNALDEAQIKSAQAREVFELQEGSVPWMDDYWALIAEGWSWRQAVYMIWAALPSGQRKPKTQGELATEVLGLTSDRRIRNWKENTALDARTAQLIKRALAHARPGIYEALIAAATNPNPRAHADRKLALEMLGDYVPKQSVNVSAGLPDDLSQADAEELRTMAALPAGNRDE